MTLKAYSELLERIQDISYLEQVAGLLRWDQETYMPRGSVKDRANQMALMSGIIHERQTSEGLGRLLDELEKADLDDDQRVNVREVRRDHKRATAIPPELVKEISKTETLSMDAWIKARQEKDYSMFKPWLEKMIDLKKRVAEHIGYEDRPYDALLDEYEPDMPTRDVEAILRDFRGMLVPLVSKIIKAADEAKADVSLLMQRFDVDAQKGFLLSLVSEIGYSFEIGRMDITTHPFTIGEANDVRITTRYNENDIRPALFACIHEAGHGIYEQGHLEKHHHTPLGRSVSLGIHESQSRLYENIVGRGRPFWEHYFPQLKGTFPQLKDVPMDVWMKAINKVQPSFIRVESDEATYNLHILLRFELELDICEGRLGADEVPGAWNERMEKFLGIVPPDDAVGCMQDVHWSMGLLGYFPTYTLGNLLSVQLYDKAVSDVPDLENSISRGDFKPLLGWLREKVHQHGRRYRYLELTKRATGSDLDPSRFIGYLKRKYGGLFDAKF